MMIRHLDLFSGIGGFSLGLESTGLYQTVAFCEIEEYPRRVLAKHWPDIPCYEDVRDVAADRLARDGIGGIDIVTGGFPCQDISLAGARAGLSGERSGLWSELLRVCVEVRPRWLIAENVPGLRTLGADRVLSDLAGAGYAAWPLVVGAVHAGAPHRRQRVWIVAHANEQGEPGLPKHDEVGGCVGEYAPHSISPGRGPNARAGPRAESERPQLFSEDGEALPSDASTGSGDGHAAHAGRERLEGQQQAGAAAGAVGRASLPGWSWNRAPVPVLRRMDDGLPCGMDRRERLKALGNAVVPQIVALIGRTIAETDAQEPQPTDSEVAG